MIFLILHDIYIKIKAMKWNQEDIEKVKNLIIEGKNYVEIGDLLNKSRDSIRYVANKYGFTFETYNPKPSVNCQLHEKYCGTCKLIKNKDEFNKNSLNKDGLNTICRECSKKRSKRYYAENPIKHKKEVSKRRKLVVHENRKQLINYLKTHPCIDCGETNVIVLEFDHRDDVKKDFNISESTNSGYSWNRIKNEIDKCDVRCANCHRIKTAKQFEWYKDFDLT